MKSQLLMRLTAGTALIAASATMSCAGMAQEEETGLNLGVSVTGTYSDNYLRLSDEMLAERPNLEKADYVLDTKAIAEWRQRVGRQTAYVNVDLGYRNHKNNSSFDKVLLGSAAGLDWRLGAKCDGNGEVGYDRSMGEFETLADIVDNTLKSHSLTARVRCSGPGRSNIVLSGGMRGSRNSASSRALNDSDNQDFRAGLGYRLGRGDYVNMVVRKSWRQYENRLTTNGLEDRNNQTDYSLELTKAIGPRIKFDGWAGYSKVSENDSESDGFSGFSGRAGLTWDVANRHSLSLAAFREVETANTLTASWVRNAGMSASLDSNLGPRLSLHADISRYRRNMQLRPEYQEIGDTRFSSQDTSTSLTLGAGWKIGRTLTLFADGRYSKRNAISDRFDYSEKAVILGIRFKR